MVSSRHLAHFCVTRAFTEVRVWQNPGARPWGPADVVLTADPPAIYTVDFGFHVGLHTYEETAIATELDDFCFGPL